MPPYLLRCLERTAALIAFAGYFVGRSLIGGADVAWRALHPRLPIEVHELAYPLALRGDASRTLFVAVISLLPGTLACGLDGDRVRLHSISGDPTGQARALEGRIARLFGAPPAAAAER